jgi:hypothetical protein
VKIGGFAGANEVEGKLQPVKLNLRRNRPLVTLGYISTGYPELTTLEQTWASTFLRAGASAFVGPMWAVHPAIEAAFVSGFYSQLWTGASLGEAFWIGRRMAQAVVPDSLDWLAYVLYGDPMARPYRPVEGEGYGVVEPVGREMDDPLAPGESARFRVSLRRRPPVWHEGRVVEVAEQLEFDSLEAHIVTFDLQVGSTSVKMKRTPTGDYLGWFTLTAPPAASISSALVQVHLVDGVRPIHSMMFSLGIEDARQI